MKKWIFFIFIVISGCSGKPHVVGHTNIAVTGSYEVYIVSHGWHTGFVVPALAIQGELPMLEKRFSESPYLEFGWGEEGFYQAKEITSGITMRAAFWPTESVMHVAAIPERPDIYYSDREVKILCLNTSQYALLLSFIENSFYKDHSGHIVSMNKGIYWDSQFYRGEGDYFLFNTCNKWTAKGLKSAGLDIQPILSLTVSSIMSYLSKKRNDFEEGSCSSIREKDTALTD